MKLLFFAAAWCGLCHAKAPVVREIARAMELPLEVIDIQEEWGRTRAEELRIRTVPTLALVDGARVPFRLIGRLITPENAAHLAALTRLPAAGA